MLVVFHCVFLVMLLVFGVTLVHDGTQAVRARMYNLQYTERTSWAFGPAWGGTSVRDGVVAYRGRAAVVFGVGFTAAGAMQLTWATGLVVSLLGRTGLRVPNLVVRALGGLALAALVLSCIALFPPWRIHTLPLYLVVAAFTLAVTLPIPSELRKKVFPAVVILVIVVGMTTFPAFPILAGIFVSLVMGTNLLVLWPRLADRIGRRQAGPKV